MLNALDHPSDPDFHPTKIHGVVSLGEFKSLADQSGITVEACARRIDPTIENHAMALDIRYPGSTVLAEKRKYGQNGKYLAFVTGAFGNLSSDFLVLIDFITSVKAVHSLQWHITMLRPIPPTFDLFLWTLCFTPLGSSHSSALSRSC